MSPVRQDVEILLTLNPNPNPNHLGNISESKCNEALVWLSTILSSDETLQYCADPWGKI